MRPPAQRRHCGRRRPHLLLHRRRHAGLAGPQRDWHQVRAHHLQRAPPAGPGSGAGVHDGPASGPDPGRRHPHQSHHDRAGAGGGQDGGGHHGDHRHWPYGAPPLLPRHRQHRQRRDLLRHHAAGGARDQLADGVPRAVIRTRCFPRGAAAGGDRVPPSGRVRHHPLPRVAAGIVLHDGGDDHGPQAPRERLQGHHLHARRAHCLQGERDVRDWPTLRHPRPDRLPLRPLHSPRRRVRFRHLRPSRGGGYHHQDHGRAVDAGGGAEHGHHPVSGHSGRLHQQEVCQARHRCAPGEGGGGG
mmetsp:Transcript_29803/g.50081  ORF Transcript_29803/g.50081 Transcript_29803/m.50081 type:complete len:300 (+) Transcript_29803:869-1768(+)